jgi:hypothetical protein
MTNPIRKSTIKRLNLLMEDQAHRCEQIAMRTTAIAHGIAKYIGAPKTIIRRYGPTKTKKNSKNIVIIIFMTPRPTKPRIAVQEEPVLMVSPRDDLVHQ